jgi:hypothetical protein
VPTEEMPVVYQNDKAKDCELRINQWVRIKHSGAYNGDIALVENISDNKVWVRTIPRIDLTASAKKKSFMRIPQKLNFYPTA